jgi:hypothetical protein
MVGAVGRGRSRFWVSAAAGACAAAAAFWLARPDAGPPAPDDVAAPPPPGEAPAPGPGADEPPGAPDLATLPRTPADLPPGFVPGDPRMPWGIVDLDEVRRAMPDNLYWQLAAPTDDLRVEQERADERARWNVEYGKVLSGTGSAEEIEAYFAHRHRLSADYVEFVGYVLDHYGDQLPEQDVGLLELARTLHLARLEEIPRQTQEALARKEAQDRAREAWQREEAEFAAGGDAAAGAGDEGDAAP